MVKKAVGKQPAGNMAAAELLRHLGRKMGAITDGELAAVLGIKQSVLSHWRKETTVLTPLKVANAIFKAREFAQRQVHSNAIKAIVEFFPIEVASVGRNGNSCNVFGVGKDAGKHRLGLHKQLIAAKSGLYIFYDSRGRAIYAGQTKRQNIWKEMNLAFNRDRRAQVMTLVRHPKNQVDFRPASLKVRQPTDCNLRLHDIAAYFSAYEILPEMVDDLEALLVRAFPNDLLNIKMERFGKAARRAAMV